MQQVPRFKKFSEGYRDYLIGLKEYLTQFAKNTQPLLFEDNTSTGNESSSFDQKWAEGLIVGWEDRGIGGGSGDSQGGFVSTVLDELRVLRRPFVMLFILFTPPGFRVWPR